MNIGELHEVYSCDGSPAFITEISTTAPLRRLSHIGMNCGCEYTHFHLFEGIGRYTRLDHSMGAALIVWHFTGDMRQSVSALLHDIATPSFAHVIDFLHGDHMRQESTEDATLQFITGSKDLVDALAALGLEPEDVSDYHIFPIADNDTPRLSSDRLEYTCGNILNYGFADIDVVKRLYDDLMVGRNEDGEDEIMFRSAACASEFAELSLKCSKIYVCDADRFAMQRLAEILASAIKRGVISEKDLYLPEEKVISKLEGDLHSRSEWEQYRSYSTPIIGSEDDPLARIIFAKKRHINPFVYGTGRVTSYDVEYRRKLETFLATDFNYKVSAR